MAGRLRVRYTRPPKTVVLMGSRHVNLVGPNVLPLEWRGCGEEGASSGVSRHLTVVLNYEQLSPDAS